jgi:microsomal epoxide hydrolase
MAGPLKFAVLLVKFSSGISMASPVPFQISIPESEISRLLKKLEDVRFPDELEDSKWDYGVPLSDMKRLVKYWKESFNWKEQENMINAALPQFTFDIPVDGFGSLNIHFVHQRSKVENAIPLLFVHGCRQILTWPRLISCCFKGLAVS